MPLRMDVKVSVFLSGYARCSNRFPTRTLKRRQVYDGLYLEI